LRRRRDWHRVLCWTLKWEKRTRSWSIDHSKAPWPYSKGYCSALHRSEAAWLRTSNKIKCTEVAQNGNYWSYFKLK
jgi:hypothetical protein